MTRELEWDFPRPSDVYRILRADLLLDSRLTISHFSVAFRFIFDSFKKSNVIISYSCIQPLENYFQIRMDFPYSEPILFLVEKYPPYVSVCLLSTLLLIYNFFASHTFSKPLQVFKFFKSKSKLKERKNMKTKTRQL